MTCSILQRVRAWNPILNCFFCSFNVVFGLFKVSLHWATLLTLDAFVHRSSFIAELWISNCLAIWRAMTGPLTEYGPTEAVLLLSNLSTWTKPQHDNSFVAKRQHIMWSAKAPVDRISHRIPCLLSFTAHSLFHTRGWLSRIMQFCFCFEYHIILNFGIIYANNLLHLSSNDQNSAILTNNPTSRCIIMERGCSATRWHMLTFFLESKIDNFIEEFNISLWFWFYPNDFVPRDNT